MMKKLFKAALVVAAFAGFQVMGTIGASASDTGLLQYAKDPTVKEVTQFKPIKVAGWRSKRRNRFIGGAVATGIAAIILSEALRSKRKRHYYNDNHYYDNSRVYSYRSSRPSRYQCRKWARRCDWGNRRACRKWNRRCY